jgi:hypothetical protein
MSRLAASLWAALALGLAPQIAHAQGANPDAQKIIHSMFGAIDMNAALKRGVTSAASSFDELTKIRPAWGPMVIDTLQAEFAADLPQIEDLYARRLAAKMSPAELQAGARIMSDPGMIAQITASANHAPQPGLTLSKETMRELQTPGGRTFMQKVGQLDQTFGPDVNSDLIALVIPKWLQRFGAAAEAAERARPQPGV